GASMKLATFLVVAVGALILLSGGSAFASNPLEGADAAPEGPLGPFCFHVAQANPVRPITNLKLVVQQVSSPIVLFPILGQEFGGPAVSFFLFGFGFQLGPQVGFIIASTDFVGTRLVGRTLSGILDS